jgi:hypothetical protein
MADFVKLHETKECNKFIYNISKFFILVIAFSVGELCDNIFFFIALDDS